MRRFLLLGAVLTALACAAKPRYALPDLKLPVLGGGAPLDLRACQAQKCLVAYVAPWCPHCREAAPYIVKLSDYLGPKNIPTRVIVGQDQPEALEAYARVFGPATALDRNNEVAVNGVPHFFVIDHEGRLISEKAGFPPGYDGPVSALAEQFGLP